MDKKKIRGLLSGLLLLLALAAGRRLGLIDGFGSAGSADAGAVAAATNGADEIAAAFRAERSGFLVEVAGEVERVLPDDRDGSRHQRFLLRLANGHSLLVAHNIDLAPRVPVLEGDRLELLGQYEWNEKGGVLHWTHRDPDGRRQGGWIRLAGKRYE